MEDIIDIIVTETTNTIEITAQPNDEIIDVNIIDNREDITLNVTPTVVEININSLTGNFGILWGEIEGTLSNQTDLQNVLNLKADLVDGKVPSSQLPSYVDDVVEVANYAALPATGEVGKIYITLDTNFIYRWTGSTYVEIKDSSAVWGAITGTLSNQTDLQNALNAKLNVTTAASTYVPYTGATTDVNLGLNNFDANQINGLQIVAKLNGTGSSPLVLKTGTSGYSYGNDSISLISSPTSANTLMVISDVSSVTKIAEFAFGSLTTTRTFTLPDASGTLALTSQLHNAVTIGTANGLSLNTQVLSLGLASSSANGALSSTDWTTFNAKQEALSGTGFVKISGTTISYDNSTYAKRSGLTDGYLPAWSSSLLGGSLTDSFISYASNITYVAGMGLSTLNGLDIEGNYGAGGGGLKIRSYDETTGNAYIDFANTGGRMYLGLNRSTAGGLMTNATAYATVLTTGLGTSNLEFGTNATKRMTIDGTTGAVTLTSALSGTSASFSSTVVSTGGFGSAISSLSSWGSSIVAPIIEGIAGNAIANYNGGGGSAEMYIVSNAYYNGSSWVRKNASASTILTMSGVNNSITFGGAATGTAGSTFSYTNILSMNASTGAATFSSSVTATELYLSTSNGLVGNINSSNANGGYMTWGTSGTTIADIGTLQQIFGSGGSDTFGINARGARSLHFGTNNTSRFIISSTGAATFSSSVTASSTITVTASANNIAPQFVMSQTGGNTYSAIGINRADGTGIAAGLGSALVLRSGDAADAPIQFATANNVRMTIGTTGNVGIGTTSPLSGVLGGGLQITNSTAAYVRVNGTGFTGLDIIQGGDGTGYLYLRDNNDIRFGTNNTERMRITSGGYVHHSNTGSYIGGGTGAYYTFSSDNASAGTLYCVSTSATIGVEIFNVYAARNTTNNTFYAMRYYNTAAGAAKFLVADSGNVTNTNNSYGAISDIKLKENISDATSKLSDLLKIKVKNYNYIGSDEKQLGVIAQDVEQIFPGLIEVHKDKDSEGNDLGTVTKSVKYSVFVPMLIKAVQELSDKITTLENK